MKGKNILAIFIAVMVLSIAISCVYAEDKMELRLRLEKGQSYKTKTVQDMKINQTIPGQQQAMTIIQKTEGRNIYTVEDVQSDGTAVVKVTYDAILFKMETMGGKGGMGGNIEYDSTNPSTAVGPMALIFNAIVGQSFSMTMTPDGHVKEIHGADEIFKRMQEKINELPNAQMRAAMETSLKAQYGDRICFLGNLDIRFTLCSGTVEEARQAMITCIEKGWGSGGHIIMTSNVVHHDVKPENYLAALEAHRAYFGY